MTRYLDDVQPAVVALSGLQAQMLADLAPTSEGIRWWGHLDPARRILIGDYLFSLTQSIEGNLVEASMHRRKAAELWKRESDWFRGRIVRLAHGDTNWMKATAEIENGRVEADAHLGGYFRALGSVMDNLAGLTIGVAGLAVGIVKADIRDLRLDRAVPRGALPEGEDGHGVQLQLVSAIKQAVGTGPTGWLAWVDGMRNTLVHRARRLTINLQDKKGVNMFVRPLPRVPKHTDAEALARSGLFTKSYLTEDATKTLEGLMTVVLKVAIDTANAAVNTWAHRREHPGLIVQPKEQWPNLSAHDDPGFDGCTTSRLPRITGDNQSLYVSPTWTSRIRSAQLMDGDRTRWRTWLQAP